ncbi:MAG: prepilin peptidase [Candidatus Syntrophonatronum acetioxidans]|uniref:Prepilin peptidase n=1 Tax=Candidatus Syntrophonatronum acetioxidans TaxID=1795816 RepID=A0A424YAI3_9FIRM|nr:MAG: prepilin peptidase [Candidatus Syntrophonatronum acetioxidans]
MNSMVINFVLLILLISSVIFDLTQKKIPNFLTFPVILFGLIFHTASGMFNGLLFSLWGFLLGIGLFLIPFMVGGMGGGDVKLLGAIGALKGTEFVFIATFYTAICGGVIALIYLALKGELINTLKKVLGLLVKPLLMVLAMKFRSSYIKELDLYFSPSLQGREKKSLFFPYGVAIGIGTVIALSDLASQLLPIGALLFR